MKISIYIFFLQSLFFLTALRSQNGLEGIIVEKYYVSGPADTTLGAYFGNLPVGSTTYRIYADMLPGYRFQAAYGTPEHALKIETTTTFFNNWDIGNKNPEVIPFRTLKRNTVMLDSWLTAGAAGEGVFGIMKADDDTLETVVHEKPYLSSEDQTAGIPLKHRDGLVFGNRVPRTVFYGVDDIVPVFFKQTGSVFATSNGAWACLEGSVGPDSLTTNRVLIAQLTTDGDLSFQLNLQIGRRNMPPENYVAKDPVEKEILLPTLIYHSKDAKLTTLKNKKPAGSK